MVFKKEDGQQPGVIVRVGGRDRLHAEADHPAPGRAINRDVGVGDRGVLGAAAADRRGGGQVQVLMQHGEKVQCRLARRQGQVIAVAAEKVQHRIVRAKDDRSRHELFQELGVDGFAAGVRRGGASLVDAGRRDGLDVGDRKGGRGEVFDFAFTFVQVDFFRAADRFEQVDVFAGRLALAKEEVAVVFERRVEDGKQPAPQHRLEIDHDVAAADQIQLAERRVREDVVGGEHNHPPHFLADLVLIVLLDEELGQTLRGYIVQNIFRVQALAGLLDRAGIDIGRKDFDIPRHLHLLHRFAEKDCEGVGFLPGGAAGAPNPDRLVLRRALDDFVDGVIFELFKESRVAEEVCHPDQDLLDKGVDLLGGIAEQPGEIRQRGGVGHQHPPFDPAQDRCALVIGKVDAARIFQDRIDVGEGLLL